MNQLLAPLHLPLLIQVRSASISFYLLFKDILITRSFACPCYFSISLCCRNRNQRYIFPMLRFQRALLILSDHADLITLQDITPRSDTNSLYYDFVGSRVHLWETPVNVPKIYDFDGSIISPRDYEHKLVDMTPVTVNVTLKLFVSFLFISGARSLQLFM